MNNCKRLREEGIVGMSKTEERRIEHAKKWEKRAREKESRQTEKEKRGNLKRVRER